MAVCPEFVGLVRRGCVPDNNTVKNAPLHEKVPSRAPAPKSSLSNYGNIIKITSGAYLRIPVSNITLVMKVSPLCNLSVKSRIRFFNVSVGIF